LFSNSLFKILMKLNHVTHRIYSKLIFLSLLNYAYKTTTTKNNRKVLLISPYFM